MLNNSIWISIDGRDILYCGLLLDFFLKKNYKSKKDIEKHVSNLRHAKEPPCALLLGQRLKKSTSISFEITKKCNFQCTYCYVDENATNGFSTMTKEIADQCLKHILNNNIQTKRVSFIGGEPLTNCKTIIHIIENLDRLSPKTIYYSLFTNGSLIPYSVLNMSNKYRINWIISLDGPENLNDMHRGKGAFSSALKTIKLLQRRGISYSLEATLTPDHLADGFNPQILADWFKYKFPSAKSINISPVNIARNRSGFTSEQIELLSQSKSDSLALSLDAYTKNPELELPSQIVRPIVAYLSKIKCDFLCPETRKSKLFFSASGRIGFCNIVDNLVFNKKYNSREMMSLFERLNLKKIGCNVKSVLHDIYVLDVQGIRCIQYHHHI